MASTERQKQYYRNQRLSAESKAKAGSETAQAEVNNIYRKLGRSAPNYQGGTDRVDNALLGIGTGLAGGGVDLTRLLAGLGGQVLKHVAPDVAKQVDEHIASLAPQAEENIEALLPKVEKAGQEARNYVDKEFAERPARNLSKTLNEAKTGARTVKRTRPASSLTKSGAKVPKEGKMLSKSKVKSISREKPAEAKAAPKKAAKPKTEKKAPAKKAPPKKEASKKETPKKVPAKKEPEKKAETKKAEEKKEAVKRKRKARLTRAAA